MKMWDMDTYLLFYLAGLVSALTQHSVRPDRLNFKISIIISDLISRKNIG